MKYFTVEPLALAGSGAVLLSCVEGAGAESQAKYQPERQPDAERECDQSFGRSGFALPEGRVSEPVTLSVLSGSSLPRSSLTVSSLATAAHSAIILQRARTLVWEAACFGANPATCSMCLSWLELANAWAIRKKQAELQVQLQWLFSCLSLEGYALNWQQTGEEYGRIQ